MRPAWNRRRHGVTRVFWPLGTTSRLFHSLGSPLDRPAQRMLRQRYEPDTGLEASRPHSAVPRELGAKARAGDTGTDGRCLPGRAGRL